MERITLAREYRVVDWLRNAYLELTQRLSLDLDSEELHPEPYSNGESDTNGRDWEAEAKKWEAVSREWETLARISQLQTKMLPTTSLSYSTSGYSSYCNKCSYTSGRLCPCRILDMVNETFQGELESLKENLDHVDPPLPCKLFQISYHILCSVENFILFV
jgi:hypothetical protein